MTSLRKPVRWEKGEKCAVEAREDGYCGYMLLSIVVLGVNKDVRGLEELWQWNHEVWAPFLAFGLHILATAVIFPYPNNLCSLPVSWLNQERG